MARVAGTYTPKQGDTWESIAAEQLGNATLGAEIAGHNGLNAQGPVPVGQEIEIPRRFVDDERSAAPAPAPAAAAGPAPAPITPDERDELEQLREEKRKRDAADLEAKQRAARGDPPSS